MTGTHWRREMAVLATCSFTLVEDQRSRHPVLVVSVANERWSGFLQSISSLLLLGAVGSGVSSGKQPYVIASAFPRPRSSCSAPQIRDVVSTASNWESGRPR
jgi:hypothetical protein